MREGDGVGNGRGGGVEVTRVHATKVSCSQDQWVGLIPVQNNVEVGVIQTTGANQVYKMFYLVPAESTRCLTFLQSPLGSILSGETGRSEGRGGKRGRGVLVKLLHPTLWRCE